MKEKTKMNMRLVFDPESIKSFMALLHGAMHILLNFTQDIKHLLFYIPCKICKHIFISLKFISPVNKLFDNMLYVTEVFEINVGDLYNKSS